MYYLFIFIFFAETPQERLERLGVTYLTRNEDGMYECTVCLQQGKNKNMMKMHLESLHFPTDGAYVCEFCSQLFNTKKAYINHKSSKCKQKNNPLPNVLFE